MRSAVSLLAVLALLITALAGCIPGMGNPYTTPEVSTEAPTPEPAAEHTPEATTEPAPEPTEAPTPEPTAEPAPEQELPGIGDLPPEDMGAANYAAAYSQISYICSHLGSELPGVDERCAYITGMSMAMDGQTDITFDYVDWLWGEEARTQYLTDYPGATEEEMEFIDQIGYIRNMNSMLRTFRTCPETRYFLHDPENISTIVEVDYDTFRDRMFPAVEGTENTYLTYVMVCVVGDRIARVEWIYLP